MPPVDSSAKPVVAHNAAEAAEHNEAQDATPADASAVVASVAQVALSLPELLACKFQPQDLPAVQSQDAVLSPGRNLPSSFHRFSQIDDSSGQQESPSAMPHHSPDLP